MRKPSTPKDILVFTDPVTQQRREGVWVGGVFCYAGGRITGAENFIAAETRKWKPREKYSLAYSMEVAIGRVNYLLKQPQDKPKRRKAA